MLVMSLLGNSAVLNTQEQRFTLVDKQNNYWDIAIYLELIRLWLLDLQLNVSFTHVSETAMLDQHQFKPNDMDKTQSHWLCLCVYLNSKSCC